MATVAFRYRDIEDSISKAKKTASEFSDYAKHMKEVVTACSDMDGTDSKGYVDSAVELVKKKISKANTLKNSYTKLATDLGSLQLFAEEKDRAVAQNIDITVSDYVGKRKFGQAIGDLIYSGYVGFLDGVSALPWVGDSIAQGIRVVGNWVSDTTVSAFNYFKYGDGKYIWNSVKAVAGVLVAVAGTVAAAAAAVAAAPAVATVAAVGAVAAGIYAVFKFGDMMATVSENEKAMELTKKYRESTKNKTEQDWWNTKNDEGSITAARYYGSVQGVKDWIDKTDFGGKTANNVLGVVGTGYQVVETAAAVTSAVCQLATAAGNAQYLKDAKGNWIYKKNGDVLKKQGGFFNNIKTTYLEKSGYTFQRTAKTQQYAIKDGKRIITGFDPSKAFIPKFFEGYGEKFSKAGVEISKTNLLILNGSKLFNNFDGLVSNIETFQEWDSGELSGFKGGYETFEAAIDLNQNLPFFDNLTSDGMKTVDTVSKVVEGIKDIFTSPENAYEQYLNQQSAGQAFAGGGVSAPGSSGGGFRGSGAPGSYGGGSR